MLMITIMHLFARWFLSFFILHVSLRFNETVNSYTLLVVEWKRKKYVEWKGKKNNISLHPPLSTSAPFSLQVSHHMLISFSNKTSFSLFISKRNVFPNETYPFKISGGFPFHAFYSLSFSLSHLSIMQLTPWEVSSRETQSISQHVTESNTFALKHSKRLENQHTLL